MCTLVFLDSVQLTNLMRYYYIAGKTQTTKKNYIILYSKITNFNTHIPFAFLIMFKVFN